MTKTTRSMATARRRDGTTGDGATGDGATTMTMAMGDDNDDDCDGATGNEVDNDGDGATGDGRRRR